MKAYALCWPNDPVPLLYLSQGRSEEDRVYFTKNYKKDRHGNLRGDPFVVELSDLPQAPSKRGDCGDGFSKAAAFHGFEHYLNTPFESTLRAVFEAGLNHESKAAA